MKYALNLDKDGRILSATYPQYAPADAVQVDSLPEGNIADYRYINGEYVYDPLPVEPEPEPAPTTEERIKALEDGKADQTTVADLEEALNLILSGDTGEAANEA